MSNADRRETLRVRMTREVIVNTNGSEAQFCRLRDISPEGLFVEPMDTPLPADARVKVAISLPSGNSSKVYHLPAKVMRVTDDGAGLQFNGLGVDSYSAILGLMYVA